MAFPDAMAFARSGGVGGFADAGGGSAGINVCFRLRGDFHKFKR